MTRNSPKLQDDNDKQEVGWQGHLGGPGGRMFSETEAETAFVLSSMTPHLAVTDLSKLVLCCVQYSDVANVALVVSLQKGVVNFGNEKVMPPIPLIASSAEQVYNGLRYHPSYFATNKIVKLIASTCALRCQLNEVDGAYSDERLHHHLLSQPEHKADLTTGCLLETACCQNHAKHLISVSVSSLLGSNLLSRLYALAVFLRNLET